MSRQDALQIYQAAVKAVQPAAFMRRFVHCDSQHLKCGDFNASWTDIDKVYVAGAGKAAAAMGVETENILGDRITGGVIVTKYNHGLPLQYISCLEAGHPVPDENGLKATHQLINLLQRATGKDLVIFLISGGASALLCDMPAAISFKSLQELNRLLIQGGAAIHEINTIRKHLSLIKGGQMLRYVNGAQVVALIMSDVPGDDLSVIASGPTVPDSSTFKDAWMILEKYCLGDKLSTEILNWLHDGSAGKIPETPKPADQLFLRTQNYLVATNRMALDAAKEKAAELGYTPLITNDQLQGEARDKAGEYVHELMQFNGKRPACLLMGGETTVTIRGNGKGGRNQEFALAALFAMKNFRENLPLILAAGTDGSDGPTDATGAFADESVIVKMQAKHIDPGEYLDNNDAFSFFSQTGGLIITGPTQTNVMDIVIGLL